MSHHLFSCCAARRTRFSRQLKSKQKRFFFLRNRCRRWGAAPILRLENACEGSTFCAAFLGTGGSARSASWTRSSPGSWPSSPRCDEKRRHQETALTPLQAQISKGGCSVVYTGTRVLLVGVLNLPKFRVPVSSSYRTSPECWGRA